MKEFKGFEASWVSCSGVIMMKVKEVFLGVGRNISTIAKVKDTIGESPIT